MDNLPVVNKSMPLAPTTLNAILNGGVVSATDEDIIFSAVRKAVTIIYRDTGFSSKDSESFNLLCNGLTNYLIDNQQSFRIEEIEIAFGRGILGDFGPYMGISFVTCVNFILAYKKSIERVNAIAELKKQNEIVKAKPLLPEQFKTAKENVEYAFQSRKLDKDIQRAAAMNYDFLVSLGLCIYDKEAKQVIWREAIHFTIGQQQEKKAVADLFARDAINKLIDTFNAGPDPESKEFNTIIINAKYLTLCKYFDDLILTGANLSDLVEGKREVFYNLKSK